MTLKVSGDLSKTIVLLVLLVLLVILVVLVVLLVPVVLLALLVLALLTSSSCTVSRPVGPDGRHGDGGPR